MRPIIDAHLDLARNARHWNRDLLRTLGAMNRAESHQWPGGFGSIFDLHKLEAIPSGRGDRGEDLDAILYGNRLRTFTESLPALSGDEA